MTEPTASPPDAAPAAGHPGARGAEPDDPPPAEPHAGRLLEGAPIAAEILAAVREDVVRLTEARGEPPGLAVVIVGKDAPSVVYLERILKGCEQVGIAARFVEVEGAATEVHVIGAIADLNADDSVDGIIVQMPLPATIRLRSVIDAIDPAKDIDGIHPLNAGLLRLGYDGFLPATAHAAVEILRRSAIEIEGRRAVVIGRSPVVGMPAAFLLVREDATVTVCHSRTQDLASIVREADIVVVAAGRPGLITGSMLKPGATVVDVGINVVDGRLVGDVDFASARLVAGAITPVPGGVGPLTNAILLSHLARAANARQERKAVGGGRAPEPPTAPVPPAASEPPAASLPGRGARR